MSVNPFNQLPEVQLLPGEAIAPLNPYTNKGYVILPYYYVTTFGRYFSTATGRLEEKKLQLNLSGYHEIGVITTAGQKHLLAHRGVLSTFCPIFDMNELQVDHINGNHLDNRIENLRWVTGQQNVQSAVQKKITPPRTRNITDEDIIKIVNLAHEGYTDQEIYNEICDEVKISEQTIRIIRTGQSIYGPILEKYNLKPFFRANNQTPLTQEQLDEMIELFEQGYTTKEIANKLNLTRERVERNIKKFQMSKNRGYGVSNEETKKKVFSFISTPDEMTKDGAILYPVNINSSNLHVLESTYAVTKDGRIFSNARGGEWKELIPTINIKGYATVGLNTNHGNRQYMIHRIMLATFKPRDDMYELEVDHINGVKDDNRLENLDWVTHSVNMQRLADRKGDDRPIQRAPDEDIIRINQLAWEGKSDDEISAILNGKYTPHNINIIRAGQKTYGPVLEKLGLKPFKYQQGPIPIEVKEDIYNYIESIKDKVGMMTAYSEAGKKFDISSETIRTIYGKMRKNK